jgi:hypothetical protein
LVSAEIEISAEIISSGRPARSSVGNSIFTRNVPASFPLTVAVAAVKRNLRQKKLPRKKAAARKGGQEKEIVLERI